MQWGLFSEKSLASIAESQARLNIWHGAVRSSKTVSSLVRWLFFVEHAPPGDLLMIGKTERTLKRNILNILDTALGPKAYRHNQGEGEVWIHGRRIYTAGANDEQAASKIRGMTLAGAYGDEVTLWPSSMFKELLNRLSVRGAKAFFTTNPDNPFHWLKTDYLDRQSELTLASWCFTLDDNPNLDPDYISSLKREHTGLWYDRMILGLWVMAEGRIYDQFDEQRHGFGDADAPDGFDFYSLAIDYGTQNAFAALLTGHKGDTAWVVREYYFSGRDAQKQAKSQKTDAEYSADLRRWLNGIVPSKVIIDPSAASMKEQLRRDGFSGLVDADNDVLDGIRCVSNRLTTNRIRIHRTNCPHTMRELQNYAWDQRATQKGEDKPLKVDDHAADALRYMAFTLYGKPQIEVVTARQLQRLRRI